MGLSFEAQLSELNDLKDQLVDLTGEKNNHVSEACRFFRRLSGESISGYGRLIGVSHTYWSDLETGNRNGPSEALKRKISEASGLSYDSVKYIFDTDELEINDLYKLVIDSLEQNVKQRIRDKIKRT